MLSVSALVVVYAFVSKISPRVLRLEKKLVEVIKSFSKLHDRVNENRNEVYKRKKENDIEFMEGDMDLIMDDKRASFKAIYYPKKVRKK